MASPTQAKAIMAPINRVCVSPVGVPDDVPGPCDAAAETTEKPIKTAAVRRRNMGDSIGFSQDTPVKIWWITGKNICRTKRLC